MRPVARCHSPAQTTTQAAVGSVLAAQQTSGIATQLRGAGLDPQATRSNAQGSSQVRRG